jgi:phospholipase C
MDGFAFVEGKFAHDEFLSGQNFTDFTGKRAMGYYDQTDLPFYYFMATNFAMSDRFFSAAPTRTTPNRLYWMAATSQGWIVPPTQQLNAKTIFEVMDNAHITWKIYRGGKNTYFSFFSYSNTHSANVVPLSQYFTDVQNGTLPQVAYIETGVEAANGETPSAVDEHPNDDIQIGAQFAAKLINALMTSPSWKDSVFIQTYDEGGGLYDHVPPMAVTNPDGIPPMLDTGNGVVHTPGDFTFTGFRVPMFVVSPFAKKNFVSHTPMDFTAALKLIETRFNLPNLTLRDASMPDMTEFFDFTTSTGPWATPPSPPTQPVNLPCTQGVPAG